MNEFMLLLDENTNNKDELNIMYNVMNNSTATHKLNENVGNTCMKIYFHFINKYLKKTYPPALIILQSYYFHR